MEDRELEDSFKFNCSIDAADAPCFNQIIRADVCKKNENIDSGFFKEEALIGDQKHSVLYLLGLFYCV